MKVLVVSQYFWPENFRVNEVVEGFVARGHDVTVLTGQPNYPGGDFFPGYGWRGPCHEYVLGAQVVRAPLIARAKGGSIRLAFNYISFALLGSFAVGFRLRGPFDVIFVCQLSPVTVGIPAIVAARKFNAPVLFWILDLWPDSLAATGAIRSPTLLRMVGQLVRWIYRRCSRILLASRAFVADVVRHGAEPDKLHYFPNWTEEEYETDALPPREGLVLPDGFRIVFAGNIGTAQDFPGIIAAARKVADRCPNVRWIIAGDGRMAEWARSEVTTQGLAERFTFLGQQPAASMPALFAAADALLVSLKDDPVFSLTIPGKVQSYLAAGRPILAMLDGEGARILTDAGAGFTCRAGDAEGLARNVSEIVALTAEERAAMGERGRCYARSEFGREPLFDRLEAWCFEAVATSGKVRNES